MRKQHFPLSRFLFFRDNDEVKSTLTKYPNTLYEKPLTRPPQRLVPAGPCTDLSALANGMSKNRCGPNEPGNICISVVTKIVTKTDWEMKQENTDDGAQVDVGTPQ